MESVAVLDQDIFLDIEKAYDSLWKEGLMIKMYELGIRGRMFNLIRFDLIFFNGKNYTSASGRHKIKNC